jgi:riboflavin synthase
MFTGLVRERGRIAGTSGPSVQGGRRLVIALSEALRERLAIGASLSVSGVCLTIVRSEAAGVVVELSPETLRRTTLGDLAAGDAVNLEPALAAGEAMGGHWVQGHVDATLELLERRARGDHVEARFALPAEHEAVVVEKGSVTLEGVSLTVSARDEGWFEVALIPHTLEVTTLGSLEPGDRVNFEVDILAKYVRQALVVAGVVPT